MDKDHVTPPMDFHHPYTPYSIQETFMSTVYQVLEEGKVGILESPTGTGKSLSLICGSLTWLRDHKRKTFEDGLNWGENESDEPEWVVKQTKERKRRAMIGQREELEARLEKIRAREKAQRQKYLKGEEVYKKRKFDGNKSSTEQYDEEEFIVDDYESDSEKSKNKDSSGLSAETLALLEKVRPKPKEEELEVPDEIKIFYCSRTHSQLTQFINELRRVQFPPGIVIEGKAQGESNIEGLKHLTLGSRKNLCINPKVNKLSSTIAINERCLELQQSKFSKDQKCGFMPTQENETLKHDFRDHALATIRDIEDMGALGKQLCICPYYASRSAIRPAEIVTLPYPLLLQKSAREAVGLSLKGHVVIIDEAHNLMDAIAGIQGVEISLDQLNRAKGQLVTYLQKFRSRLKGKNRVYISQLLKVIGSLITFLEGKLAAPLSDGIVTDQDMFLGKGVDQIHFSKLRLYLQESKLARKVESYTIHTLSTTPTTQSRKPESASPVLHHISSLLEALDQPANEGRLFFSKENDSIILKFMLLDPSSHFKDIVDEAKAVILAGGTMSPMADYTSHLLPDYAADKIITLSCGHVIPPSNLVAWNVSTGPSGKPFEFTYKERGNIEMLDELGRALLNICTIVPDGVVVFFPSYKFLDTVVQRWSIVNQGKSIWGRLEGKKALFREKKEESVDAVLGEYSTAIDAGKGGLLLSVVGGKMSEGINFSDRLGRCVIIVGLPFPNANSAEWKAKMEHVEHVTLETLAKEQAKIVDGPKMGLEEIKRKAKDAGREFYENACMRAVNQSVGRAIRHREDYAAILMIDKRFDKENIKGKLPAWIQGGLVAGAGEKGFGLLMGTLGAFFRSKKGV